MITVFGERHYLKDRKIIARNKIKEIQIILNADLRFFLDRVNEFQNVRLRA